MYWWIMDYGLCIGCNKASRRFNGQHEHQVLVQEIGHTVKYEHATLWSKKIIIGCDNFLGRRISRFPSNFETWPIVVLKPMPGIKGWITLGLKILKIPRGKGPRLSAWSKMSSRCIRPAVKLGKCKDKIQVGDRKYLTHHGMERIEKPGPK